MKPQTPMFALTVHANDLLLIRLSFGFITHRKSIFGIEFVVWCNSRPTCCLILQNEFFPVPSSSIKRTILLNNYTLKALKISRVHRELDLLHRPYKWKWRPENGGIKRESAKLEPLASQAEDSMPTDILK